MKTFRRNSRTLLLLENSWFRGRDHSAYIGALTEVGQDLHELSHSRSEARQSRQFPACQRQAPNGLCQFHHHPATAVVLLH